MAFHELWLTHLLTPPKNSLVQWRQPPRVLQVDISAVRQQQFNVLVFTLSHSKMESRPFSGIPHIQIYLICLNQEKERQKAFVKLGCTVHQLISVLELDVAIRFQFHKKRLKNGFVSRGHDLVGGRHAMFVVLILQ